VKGQLDGRVGLVTGASSGIGRATAIAFARAGAKVVVASRRSAEGERTVCQIKEMGGEAIFVQTDVSKADEVNALVNKTVDIYGSLDCVCNNAGLGGKYNLLVDMSEENWNSLVDINLKGTWLCLKYEISRMLKQGSGAIVNVASAASVVGLTGYAGYCATKGGIVALSRTAALEYADKGIRINVISPSGVDTEMLATLPPDVLAKFTAMHPIGRIAKPEEIAETVVWLCSDVSSFVIGHNLLCDGGYTAQ
jgi:NAD(P)-dependent dehydrogenase (short-subunit alcohol dehydrogenase family)